MTRYGRRSVALAVALAMLAGYVDATGFLSVGSYFVSFMSGNSTRLGIGLGKGDFRYALVTAGVVVLFVLGVMLGALVSRWAGPRRKPAVLYVVAALLAVAALCESAEVARFGTATMLLAMGAANAAFQRRGEVSVGVTYVTGALVRMGHRLTAALLGGPRWAWLPYAFLWLGLVLGAAAGALGRDRLGIHGLWPAVPVALVLATLSIKIQPRFP